MFQHVAKGLQESNKVVFTAQSAKNFHLRMLICKHAFDSGCVPINPFTLYGYFLNELVDRDLVRNANTNIMKRCDELWVYGQVSDGVLAEIQMFQEASKPIRYFDISQIPNQVVEIDKDELIFEADVEKFRDFIL